MITILNDYLIIFFRLRKCGWDQVIFSVDMVQEWLREQEDSDKGDS